MVSVTFSGPGPGSYFDFAVLSRQVPSKGSAAAEIVASAAQSASANANRNLVMSSPRSGISQKNGLRANTNGAANLTPSGKVTAAPTGSTHDESGLRSIASMWSGL